MILLVGRLLFGDLPRVIKEAATAIRLIATEVKSMQASDKNDAVNKEGDRATGAGTSNSQDSKPSKE